jgi:hypothetical protein
VWRTWIRTTESLLRSNNGSSIAGMSRCWQLWSTNVSHSSYESEETLLLRFITNWVRHHVMNLFATHISFLSLGTEWSSCHAALPLLMGCVWGLAETAPASGSVSSHTPSACSGGRWCCTYGVDGSGWVQASKRCALFLQWRRMKGWHRYEKCINSILNSAQIMLNSIATVP